MITKESLVTDKNISIKLRDVGYAEKTLFAWTEHKDAYGKLWLLDENTGAGLPAYTLGELILLLCLHKKSKWQRFIFYIRHGYDINKIANYLIKKHG